MCAPPIIRRTDADCQIADRFLLSPSSVADGGRPIDNANELSAREAAAQIASGYLTSEALVRACLARIEARDPAVQAWEFLDPDAALERARRRDRSPPAGPFHGLPVGVKDVLDTADMPTLWGDEATFAGRRPERDAPVVQRLREEGAVLLGKTAISRFGFWWPGKSRNPHNTEHTPGSSSSGSAAAVADFMCPLAIGTQTAGSIMRPAAFCGIVGMIPTHGWMPWRNSRDYAPSLDVVGGLTRSVGDMIFLMRGLTGQAEYDPDAMPDGPVSVGLYRTTDWDAAPDYTRASFEDAAKRLADGGCAVREVRLPETYERLVETLETINGYEAARSFEWEMTDHRDLVEPGLIDLLDQGWAIPRERYLAAQAHAAACRQSFAKDIEGVDLLMAPGALGEAPKATSTGHNEFIVMWTILHGPNVSLPAGAGPSGLPLGVQLIGRRGDDAAHLKRARRIEEILACPTRP